MGPSYFCTSCKWGTNCLFILDCFFKAICAVNSLEKQRCHCTPEQRTDVLIAHYQTSRIPKLRIPLPFTKPAACTCINLDSSVSLIPMGFGSKDGAMENMWLLILLAGQPVINTLPLTQESHVQQGQISDPPSSWQSATLVYELLTSP